jgi:hypothetical protein
MATIALCVNGLLLWQSEGFPQLLPHGTRAWVEAYFHLFSDPLTSTLIFLFTVLLALATFCISEMLLGLVFSIITGALAVLSLLGQIAYHYPPFSHFLIHFFN